MIPANHDDEAIHKLPAKKKPIVVPFISIEHSRFKIFVSLRIVYVRIIYLKPQNQFSVKCNKKIISSLKRHFPVPIGTCKRSTKSSSDCFDFELKPSEMDANKNHFSSFKSHVSSGAVE